MIRHSYHPQLSLEKKENCCIEIQHKGWTFLVLNKSMWIFADNISLESGYLMMRNACASRNDHPNHPPNLCKNKIRRSSRTQTNLHMSKAQNFLDKTLYNISGSLVSLVFRNLQSNSSLLRALPLGRIPPGFPYTFAAAPWFPNQFFSDLFTAGAIAKCHPTNRMPLPLQLWVQTNAPRNRIRLEWLNKGRSESHLCLITKGLTIMHPKQQFEWKKWKNKTFDIFWMIKIPKRSTTSTLNEPKRSPVTTVTTSLLVLSMWTRQLANCWMRTTEPGRRNDKNFWSQNKAPIFCWNC